MNNSLNVRIQIHAIQHSYGNQAPLTPMHYAKSRWEHSNDINWDEGIPGVAKLGFRRLSITLETNTTDSLGDIELEWVATSHR